MSDALIGKGLAVLCAFLWAVAVIFFKRSGETVRPLALNLFKSTMSLLLFIPIFFIWKIPFFPENLNNYDFWMLILSGFLGIAVSDSLFFMSLNMLGAGLSAIVDCLYSPLIMMSAWIFLSDKITAVELIGAFLVLSAILIATLKTKKARKAPRKIFWGVVFGAAAMMSMALGVICMDPVLEKHHVLWVTELRLAAGVLALAVMFAFRKDKVKLLAPFKKAAQWKYALPGSFIGTNLAMLAWVGAFKYSGVTPAAILNQTSTIFIVVLAAFFLREPLTLRKILGAVLGITGAVIVIMG